MSPLQRQIDSRRGSPAATPARQRVEARLEAICMKGCRQVRLDIANLECGGDIPECRGLAAEERSLLLTELREIMAVYEDTCRVA